MISENEKALLSKIQELEEANSRLTLELESLRGNGKSERFKEKYATKIFDSLPDMLTVLTHSGTLVDLVSSEESNHVGEPSSMLIGRDISTMLPTEAYISIKQNLDHVIATNKGSISYHTLTVSGTVHYYENRIFPLDKEYLLCICRDVTDATESHMRLEQTNKRMKLAEDIATLSHWHYNPATQELKMPGIIPVLLGKESSEPFCNLSEYLKYVHPGDQSSLNFFMADKVNQKDYQEHRLYINGELRYLHTRIIGVREDDGEQIIEGYIQDMTDIKMVEKELIDAKEKAVQSDRLKSAFLANMSHEIRTPLNAIVGFSKLLSDTQNAEEKQQYSNIIDSNAELLLQLINDILDLSKIEAGTLEFVCKNVNLSDMCHEIYEVLRSRVNHGVTLIYEESPNVVINCDNNRMLQVITNLITNAIKFTSAGYIRFGYSVKENNMIEFYVQDTGLGIQKDKVESIFSRFTKLNNFAQGTGLGLSICKTIIEKMGGTIWAESEYSIGSKFYFTIPYARVTSMTEVASSDESTPEETEKKLEQVKTILIAEDIDSNYLLAKAALGKDFNVIRASNGLAAVDLFKKMKLDIIIMDIKMPIMDGLTATREIRKISKTIPIIALTSFAFECDRQAALESGCNDFITKPIAVCGFAEKIAKFIIERK